MAFIDYYKIMGISKDTPQKDIKAAYKKRAKQFHPDLHPDDPKAKAKFQALNEAYDVLNDPEKRAKYDQYGEHWKMAGMGGGATGGADAGGFEGFDFSQFTGGGFSDFFTQMFGGGGGRARSYRSGFKRGFDPFGNESGTVSYADRECTVNIDMYTALLGGSIIVQTPEGDKLKHASRRYARQPDSDIQRATPCQPERKAKRAVATNENGMKIRKYVVKSGEKCDICTGF